MYDKISIVLSEITNQEDKILGPKMKPETKAWLEAHKDGKKALRMRQLAAQEGKDVDVYNRDAIAFTERLHAATGQGGFGLACVKDGQTCLPKDL